MEYGFIIQTLVNHINMVWNHFHEMLHELIGYALALVLEGAEVPREGCFKNMFFNFLNI